MGASLKILDYLVRIGRLPLRIRGARVLEVGAGPAPASFATRDFYATLSSWPGADGVEFRPPTILDTLDRGEAWDSLLHHLSESLISIRGTASKDGALVFGRSIFEFHDFNVRRRHHESVADSALRITAEFDSADEWISDAAARRMAYEEGVREPSAYDIVFLCNFLTHPSMPVRFASELRRLASSLTPGGVLVILGGTGRHYPELYGRVREIVAAARLHDVSPPEPLVANEDSASLGLVADHVRQNVKWALANSPADIRAATTNALPKDIVDDAVQFSLPKFQALVFVRQKHLRSKVRSLKPP